MSPDLSLFANGVENPKTIQSVLQLNVNKLIKVDGLDRVRFLLAIAGKESSFGADNRARYERAYDDQGFYGIKSKFLQAHLKKYGALAACSYGPWQILYCKAAEHGYEGHPLALWSAEVSLEPVLSVFNHLIYNGADTLEKLADGWNSGSFRDSIKPDQYIASVKQLYLSLPTFES